MNDKELREQLQRLSIPTSTEAARERARDRALTALRHSSDGAKNDSWVSSWWRWQGWGGAFAMGVLGVLIVLLVFPKADNSSENALAKDRETLRQTESLFAGQLNAVIERDGKIQVDLAERPMPESDQPLVIQFKQNGGSVRVLSYSGKRICVELNGKRTCFEALMTSDGEVILSGENFFWSSRHPTALASCRIEARSLASTL